MILGSFLEFILGNTFPFVVFGSFGAFWLTFAATLTPFYNASIAYEPSNPAASAANPTFCATFAYFQLYMGVLCFVYMICALRTNIIFFMIFALEANTILIPRLQNPAKERQSALLVRCLLHWLLSVHIT